MEEVKAYLVQFWRESHLGLLVVGENESESTVDGFMQLSPGDTNTLISTA